MDFLSPEEVLPKVAESLGLDHSEVPLGEHLPEPNPMSLEEQKNCSRGLKWPTLPISSLWTRWLVSNIVGIWGKTWKGKVGSHCGTSPVFALFVWTMV